MNIFTNDDYRRIQAWLKANAIKDSDFAISEDTIPDEDILVITQNMSTVPTNYKIKIKDLLNSSLGKVVIDKITANIVKVNNSLTVDTSKVILNNEKGTTLQDVLNYFEEGKLNRHTDDTFDGNLTIKKNITIEGNIKPYDDTITVEADLKATREITDGQGNMLSDVNDASKGWKIEYQDPQQDEPTVRAKYVLKDYRGVPKGNVIKIYKDSAITNVYLGTVEDTCNLNTGEITKHPIHDNNEALSIVYRLDTGKYSLVNVPIKIFVTEAEFDKYRGLGITENGQVFIKLASDIESSNYLHFNELGEITADGIETRILKDLGNIITSVAGDRTMWGQYKKEEGTKDSPINEASRWGQYKKAEADRSAVTDALLNQIKDVRSIADEGLDKADAALAQIHEERQERAAADKALEDTIANHTNKLSDLDSKVIYDVSAHNDGVVFESLQALLSSSNLSTLIPESVRHGGMSIRFIQSSDNKYVQYMLMTDSWSTTVANWQGVDEEPVALSNNLVKSGGVYDKVLREQNYVPNKKINAAGAIISSIGTNDFISTKIPLATNDILYWKYAPDSSFLGIVDVFDEFDNYIEYWQGNNGANGERTAKITTPNAAYIIVSFSGADGYEPLVKINDIVVWSGKHESQGIPKLQQEIDVIHEIIENTDDEPTADSNNLVKSGGVNKTQFYNFFIGKGISYTSTTLNCLIPGVTYRVYLRNTVWEIPSNTNDYLSKFAISSFNQLQEVTLANTHIRENCKPYYDFTVPEDSEYITVGGRAANGVKVWFYIVEISSANKFDEIRQIAMYNTLPVKDVPMNLTVGTITTYLDPRIKSCLCDKNFYSISPNSTVFIKHADDIKVRIIEYDNNKTYIRFSSYTFSTSFIVGSTTKYIRISADYTARGYSDDDSNPITVNDFQDGDFGLYYKNLRFDDDSADILLNSRDSRRLSVRYVEYGYGYIYNQDGTIRYGSDSHASGWNISDDYIHVNANDKVKWNFGKYTNAKQCLIIYDGDKRIITYYTANMSIGTRTLTMPDNAKYIRISFYETFNDKPNTVPVEVNGVPYFIDSLSILNAHDTKAFPRTSDNGVIGNYYPEEIIEVNKFLINGKNSNYHRFQFLHISDNHNNNFGYAEDYLDYSPAKFLINTGDLVSDKFTDGATNTIEKAIAPDKPVYLVLGNHDYSHAPSNQAVFDFFYGNSETEGTVNYHNTQAGGVAVDKTYYSIDFATEKVKCIILDMNDGWSDSELPNIGPSPTTLGKMSQTQINWFVAELQNAKANNYHVCVFIHTLPYNVDADKRISGFCDVLDNYGLGVNSILTFLPSIVDGFINGGNVTFDYNGNNYSFTFTNGGHFVSWFCGHTHYDMAGWMQGHTDQFMINVCRPFSDTYDYFGVYDKDKLGSHFNLVTVDTNIKSLSVYRIGQQKTIFATDRKSFRVIYK